MLRIAVDLLVRRVLDGVSETLFVAEFDAIDRVLDEIAFDDVCLEATVNVPRQSLAKMRDHGRVDLIGGDARVAGAPSVEEGLGQRPCSGAGVEQPNRPLSLGE